MRSDAAFTQPFRDEFTLQSMIMAPKIKISPNFREKSCGKTHLDFCRTFVFWSGLLGLEPEICIPHVDLSLPVAIAVQVEAVSGALALVPVPGVLVPVREGHLPCPVHRVLREIIWLSFYKSDGFFGPILMNYSAPTLINSLVQTKSDNVTTYKTEAK